MNYEQIVMGIVTGGTLVKVIEAGVGRMNKKDEWKAEAQKSVVAENQRLRDELDQCREERLQEAEDGLELKAQATVADTLREQLQILKDSNILWINEVARLRATIKELNEEVMSLREKLREE